MTDVLPIDFYTTVGCHLCDQALQIMGDTLHPEDFTVKHIDIADDDTLVDRFGVHIPVLRRGDTGAFLYWPFSAQQLIGFLSA